MQNLRQARRFPNKQKRRYLHWIISYVVHQLLQGCKKLPIAEVLQVRL